MLDSHWARSMDALADLHRDTVLDDVLADELAASLKSKEATDDLPAAGALLQCCARSFVDCTALESDATLPDETSLHRSRLVSRWMRGASISAEDGHTPSMLNLISLCTTGDAEQLPSFSQLPSPTAGDDLETGRPW